jgi:hypothetical protein
MLDISEAQSAFIQQPSPDEELWDGRYFGSSH